MVQKPMRKQKTNQTNETNVLGVLGQGRVMDGFLAEDLQNICFICFSCLFDGFVSLGMGKSYGWLAILGGRPKQQNTVNEH